MKILIIEDEAELSKNIQQSLENASYVCETAIDFTSAIDKIISYQYDCVILDISLPGGSGLKILQELKAMHRGDGVLIVSAKDSLDDKIAGLNLGADDYLAKPFHLPELNARVAAIIRRKQFGGNNIIMFNEIAIDTAAHSVDVHNVAVELTAKEYELLLYLMANKRKVVSKNAIAEHLWGDNMDMADSYDFIYTHIKNLRKKLNDAGSVDYIQSVYGIGYKFINP